MATESKPSDIAITGISGCFPSADDVDELRENLFNKVDMVKETTDLHWRAGAKLGIPDRIGKISKSAKFDAAFFGVHRKQCNPMDPMTRLMMERSYEAIMDAGVNPGDLRGSNMGVFMGSYISESENSWMFVDTENGFGILGHNRSMLANRVSYWLNSHGPSYAFISADTCGMQGLSMAYRAMKEGRCDTALVGTANLVMHPEMSWHLCQLGFLSSDGRCKSFDAAADGYARSEAVVAMFLQKSKNAKRIYATVVHSDYSFYGDRQEKYIGNLSPAPLTDLLTNFYNTCGVDPRTVAYVEADGSGRKDGDQVEVNVIDKVMVRDRKTPLLIGSVKSNLGHAEACSNLVAVVKVLIAMQAGSIPPNLHYNTPSPLIPSLVEGRIQVVSETTAWDGGLVAINALGVTGEYAHILLRSHKKPKPKVEDTLPRLVVASTRTEEGMEKLLSKVEAMPFDPEYVKLLQDVYSTNIPNFIYRGYTVLNNDAESEKKTREMQRFDGTKRPVWFVFSGMGSQWPGMGTQLMALPVFAASIEKSHAILKPKGVDLKKIITDTDPTIFDNILHSFVGIAAIQLALVDVLTTLGVEPDGIIGHSVGELGCAYADGCFTAEQMILSAYSRGLASIETKLIKGTMAAVGLGYQKVKTMCPPGIEVACHNSSDSSTISGPSEQMEQFVAELQANGVFARSVNVANIAYHSKYIAPAAPTLLKYLKEIIPEAKPRSAKWISTSVPESRWDTELAQYSSAEYHTNNLLSSVLFEEASIHLPKNAIAIEIAPHGLLQAILRRSMGPECTNVPLTQRGNNKAMEFLMAAVGKLYLAGLFPRVDRLYPEVKFPVGTSTASISPLITWEHSDSWHIAAEVDTIGRIAGERDVVVSLNHEEDRIYNGHVIGGRILYPVSAFLKIVWDSLGQIQSTVSSKLPVVFEDVCFHKILAIPERGFVKMYVLLQRGSGDFEISSDGELLASGRIRVPEKIEDEYVNQDTDQHESVDEISGDEIYRELEHRGYSYSGLFRGIQSVQLGERGGVGKIQWSDNWITFIDTLLQLELLQSAESKQSLETPVSIQKLVINPVQHTKPLETFDASLHRSIGVVHCGGVEIRGLKSEPIDAASVSQTNFNLATVKFVPHSNTEFQSVSEFVTMTLQLIAENLDVTQLYVLEIEDEQASSAPLAKQIEAAGHKVATTKVSSILGQNGVAATNEKLSPQLVIASKTGVKSGLSLLAGTHGFLLVKLNEKENWKSDNSLVSVAQQQCEGQTIILLRKVVPVVEKSSKVVKLTGEESSWIKQVRITLKNKVDAKLYFVGEGKVHEEIATFLKTFAKEFLTENIRTVIIVDGKAPKFSLSENVYRHQLSQDLITNVYWRGAWGSYRQSLLGKAKTADVNPAATNLGLPLKNLEGLKMHYLGINIQEPNNDELKGKKNLDNLGICDLGHLEFSGFSSSGHRLMGVARTGSKTTHLNPDQYLTWHVPDAWSLEEAATVPLAYATAYYCLILTAKLASDEKVLIHDGCSPVGQALTAIALNNGNLVYVTVADNQQKDFMKKNFPKLVERNILSLEDTSFEVLLLIETGGEGIQVIVNSLRGPKLQASLRCIAPHGRFIQLGRTDMLSNTKLGMSMFLKSTSFFGVASDNLFNTCLDWKKRLHAAVQEGIKSGVVRPLNRTVFSSQQVDSALRLLADNNKIGNVLLAVGTDKKTAGKMTSLKSSDMSSRFQCEEESSYLIVGGKAELCFDLAEWLVSRGASKIIIAQPSQMITSHIARRIGLLRQHHGAQVLLASAGKASSLQGAASIIQETCALGTLSAIFILPTETSNGSRIDDSVISNIDIASREIDTVTHFACILYDSGATLCNARREAGLTALAVHWPDNLGKDGNLWRALGVLDGILAKTADSVVYVSEERENRSADAGNAAYSDKLSTFLPSSIEDLVELGITVTEEQTNSLIELASLSPGVGLVREIPPVFIVPGLQGSSDSKTLVKPFARTLMYPTLCAQLGGEVESIVKSAAKLAKQVKDIQPEGPYNIIGASWGGALAVEIAKELEVGGDKTQVFLLDGAPETTKIITQHFGEGAQMQVNLLSRLLPISLTKVRDELLALPDWQARLSQALSKAPAELNRDHLSAAINAIYQRITALATYKPTGTRVQGVVHLLKPAEGGAEHDNCGLDQFFKQTVNIHLVDGDHRSIVYSSATASIINDAIIV